MYNYGLFVAPDASLRSSSYYPPYSNSSSLSLAQRPTYLQSLYNSKYSDNHYYPAEKIESRQEFRQPKESYHGFLDRANKNLEQEFNELSKKIASIGQGRLEEQTMFGELVDEVGLLLREYQRIKDSNNNLQFEHPEPLVDRFALLDFLHAQGLTNIKLCDVELFNLYYYDDCGHISKYKLNQLLGKGVGTQSEDLEDIEQHDQQLYTVARLITLLIQIQIVLETARQKFAKKGVRLNELFYWLDLDKDDLVSLADFSQRYKLSQTTFKLLTLKYGNSLNLDQFCLSFSPLSQAVYY